MHTLQEMLLAKSVAVVGASGKPGKMGHTLLQNIVTGAFDGPVYPINPNEKTLLGLTCYHALSEVPGQVDLVVICVPAPHVVATVREAAQRGAKGAVIISGGFREIGNDAPEKEMLDIVRQYGIRIIGPNCQGFNYTANKLCATWPFVGTRGAIGIMSQSGTIGAELELLADKEGIGVSCFAALGNKLDISEVDFIRFFVEDPHTKVIALNIEGIGENSGFVEAVTEAARKKPVVILKPGRTEKGQVAVASHTKSIAGNDRLFSVFCEKYGIIRADGMTEFYDCCKMAAMMRKPEGNRLLVVSSSGGAGILATDTAEESGVDVIALPKAAKAALGEVLPPQCVLSNPLDLTGDATAQRYADALRVVAAQRESIGCDAVLCIFGDPIPGAYEVVAEAQKACGIPILVSYLGGGEVQAIEVEKMNRNQIPVFPTPERAVKALRGLLTWKPREEEQSCTR